MAARRDTTARQATAVSLPLAESLGNQIRLTSRLLDRAIANRLKAFEIPYGAWGFLRQLWHRDGQTQLELATAVDLSGATAVAAFDRMEAMDLIRRERSSEDRRNVHIHLTRKGKALEAQLLPIAIEVNDLAVSGLSKHDIENFSKVLHGIQKALRTDEEQFNRDTRRKRLRQTLRTLD
jgi:MarR family transcriptional regulator, organic hydroperoxide resistance regulator